jgi:hypothetical protein
LAVVAPLPPWLAVVAPLPPWLAVVAPLPPWLAVVAPLPPWLAVVAPLVWLAVVAPPPGWEPPPDGADECGAEGAAFGAEPPPPPPLGLLCWAQARLGTITKLKSKSHFAAIVALGRVNFIFLSS